MVVQRFAPVSDDIRRVAQFREDSQGDLLVDQIIFGQQDSHLGSRSASLVRRRAGGRSRGPPLGSGVRRPLQRLHQVPHLDRLGQPAGDARGRGLPFGAAAHRHHQHHLDIV